MLEGLKPVPATGSASTKQKQIESRGFCCFSLSARAHSPMSKISQRLNSAFVGPLRLQATKREVPRASGDDEPESPLASTRQERRSAANARGDLRLVHRRLRHCRLERSEGTSRRIILKLTLQTARNGKVGRYFCMLSQNWPDLAVPPCRFDRSDVKTL